MDKHLRLLYPVMLLGCAVALFICGVLQFLIEIKFRLVKMDDTDDIAAEGRTEAKDGAES